MIKKPNVSISMIEFSGGQKLRLQPKEKIVIVGANNSGKSRTLREIVSIISEHDRPNTKVVTDVALKKNGTADDLINFLKENATESDGHYRYKNWSVKQQWINFWSSHQYLPFGLAAGFVKNIRANDRLQICDQQASISPGQQKTKPQHILYDDSALTENINLLFKAAFAEEIMFDFRGGSVLPIHVGVRPPSNIMDRVSDKYIEAVRRNPLLDEQGDGMKSYAGILFEALVSELDITLLDEPEAFLHPPQMRRLGQTLAAEVKGQIMVATHSSDILRGFLQGSKGNVRVIRILRNKNQNHIYEANTSVIEELWTRPELRYSNALDGIFHKQAIICEDDSDCRLFNVISDFISANDTRQWLDTAYIPTGGKHGIKKIAEVLRGIGVPVKAVFDIDILNEKTLFRETVMAFGGSWSKFEALWSRLDSAVRSGIRRKSAPEIKADIEDLLKNSPTDDVPKKEIIDILKQESPWQYVKKFGKIAIPNGNAQKDYDALENSLIEIGIYIISVGEVENFCPAIGSHGPRFVNRLLSTKPLDDKALEGLREFVQTLHFGPHAPLSTHVS